MSLRVAGTAAIFVLAVTTVFAQQNAPAGGEAPAAATPQPAFHPPMSLNRWPSRSMGRRQAGGVNPPTLEQRVEDLEATVDKMHLVLKTMRAKSVARAKDPAVKANLEMWELMVGQLDKQLQELKQAEASRQEMEARRAAMYKQADSKAQAEARAAEQAKFSPRANGTDNAQSVGQGTTAPAPAAGQAPAQRSVPNTSTSPN